VLSPSSNDETTRGPATLWLATGLLLAGLGTVLLGPILPAISLRWHLSDQQTGPLFFAKFVGSFIGGVTVPRRLRNGILSGTLLAGVGFAAFGLATGVTLGVLTLFVAGVGLGQIIASTNVLAGHRYTQRTGSALSTLNFFFSLGAVLTGLLIAALEPRLGLSHLLFTIAAIFAATGLAGRFNQVRLETAVARPDASTEPLLAKQAFVLFVLLLFLYGGLETCLAGWLTTFTLRYTQDRLAGGQSAIVLLLIALTAGRALSSVLLRYVSERTVQRAGLVCTFFFIVALSSSSQAAALSLWSILLGLALAPFFPATFALLMHLRPSARQAGFVLAVSGLGAAAFPWLMGIVSTHTGSLRVAMAVPAALALLLLAVSFIRQPAEPRSAA
jgi:FHS family glucose/mannose:H+ symporter-like MFS transporter